MKRTQSSALSKEKIRSSYDVFRALSHAKRLAMLAFIDREKLVNVNTIYTNLGLEQSVTSQHLRVLRKAGLVKTVRQGKFILYSIDYDRIEEATNAAGIISDFVETGIKL